MTTQWLGAGWFDHRGWGADGMCSVGSAALTRGGLMRSGFDQGLQVGLEGRGGDVEMARLVHSPPRCNQTARRTTHLVGRAAVGVGKLHGGVIEAAQEGAVIPPVPGILPALIAPIHPPVRGGSSGPRIARWGLIVARLAAADAVLCSGAVGGGLGRLGAVGRWFREIEDSWDVVEGG